MLSVFLKKLGRPTIYTLAPLTFLLFMAVFVLIIQARDFFTEGQYVLLVMDVVILAATIWVALESLAALRRTRRTPGEVPAGTA